MNIDIAAFKAEYKRRSAMSVYERINEDGARAKAAKADTFQQAGGWWLDIDRWEFATISALSRPTETSAFIRLRYPSGRRTGVWMRFLRGNWEEARAVVLARQRADALLRVHRQRRHLTLAVMSA